MTPDVLCETDVDGPDTFFAICCLCEEFTDDFGKVVRIICAFSLPTSLTMIVVSTWRDCPRERCCGNAVFWSFDATLKEFLSRFNWLIGGFFEEQKLNFMLFFCKLLQQFSV